MHLPHCSSFAATAVFKVCGVLMNMMGDDEGREVLRSAGGVRSLIDVLVEHGHADWQLAGMVCKTLWNFSEGYIDQGASLFDTFGEQEGEELMAVLHEYASMEDDPSFVADAARYQVWSEEFADVGEHLLMRLQSMASPLVAIHAPGGGGDND